jgi:hypothetical protein
MAEIHCSRNFQNDLVAFISGAIGMTLPVTDDFSKRELSIDELDAIAAGGWFSDAVHWVKHEASVVLHDVEVATGWIANHWKIFFPPHGPGKL